MKKGGNGISVTVWSAIAVGAVGIGVIVAFLAGYFLGHFTGHENTTTVGLVTAASAEPKGESEGGEEASETESVPAEEESVRTEEESGEELVPAEGGKESKPEEKPQEGGGEEAASGGAGNPEAGAEVFATNCSACHGMDGHGGAGGPDLRTMPKAKTEAGAIEQVTNGGGGMPPFGGTLSEEEIDNVAAYVVQDVVGGG